MLRHWLFFGLLALTLVAATPPAFAREMEEFDSRFRGLREFAVSQGIKPATFDAIMEGLQPEEKVLLADKNQPEVKLTFNDYMRRVATQERIERGRAMLQTHAALLNPIAERFDVPPQLILALWAVESDFGTRVGTYNVFQALLTLAFDGRRSVYFRQELINALLIAQRGYINPDYMLGSWAGAMGQSQFMPSSYLNFAVDGDGNGTRDLWNSLPDVFSSIANYMKNAGWKNNQGWGIRVSFRRGFNRNLINRNIEKTLTEWQALGVRRANGTPLPTSDEKGYIVLMDNDLNGPAFIVYPNFRAILRWNRSNYFAAAVGTIADGIAPLVPPPVKTDAR